MKLPLPIGAASPLGRRLAGLSFLRLTLLGAFLVVIQAYYADTKLGGVSSLIAVATATLAFVMTAVYAVVLRAGRRLAPLAHAQLVTDQLTWTAVVYVSGGVTSGSASLYGLTCLAGAVVLGTSGAVSAAMAGITSYVALAVGFAQGWLQAPSDQPRDAYLVRGHEMIYPVFSTVLAIIVVTTLASFRAARARHYGGELEKAERRVAEAEHLASLGRLAAGLAHEIRNPLGSIRGAIELLRASNALADEDVRLCRLIEQETLRLNHLVTDMVDLSRPRDPTLHEIDLALTIRNVVELARSSGLGNEIDVRYNGPAALVVIADRAQMHQVLWNLVRNALQVSTRGAEVVVGLSVERDGSARMTVTDSGPGIPHADRHRIFEAFFTTKKHGVGIGLALVKQIAESHGFTLDVDANAQRGTMFCVSIPARQVVVAAAASLLLGCGGADWLASAPRPEGRFANELADEAGEAQSAASASRELAATSNAVTASPSMRAPGEASAEPVGLVLEGTRDHELFRNTYYYFPEEPTHAEVGVTRQLFDAACHPLRTVSQDFHDRLCVQGSGRLASGETVSFAKRGCTCSAECPRTGQRICYELLDPERFPHGRGAMGRAITPFRSVAVDSAVVALGTVIYIPDFHGLRDPMGAAHDGCFVAEDRGHKVRGRHVDLFVGKAAAADSWNRAVPSNRGVRVLLDPPRCAHLRRNKH